MRPERTYISWIRIAGPAAIVVAALAVGGLSRHAPPPQLATAAAVIADIEDTVIAAGTLEASQMVSVGAQVSGQVKSLKVELGDPVGAGDLIAEIDATTQENDVRNARAALAAVRARRSLELANLRQAELAFERQKTMLEHEATSQADYENAQAALAVLRARIEALDAEIEQSAIRLDTANANLGYTRIRAPMAGVVVAVVVEEGQTVNANQAAPTIVKLAKLDVMTVKAQISEADVIKVRPGQPVYFTILGNPDKRYHGTLRTIEPAPETIEDETPSSPASSKDSAAVYYNALFEAPNPERELRIAMTAQVYVVLGQARQALTIPSSAVGERMQDGRHVVKVLDSTGLAAPRAVSIGIDNHVSAQVLDGLEPGERVVVGEASAISDARRRGRPGMLM